ncbi:zona pellucida sperm-binding protein 3-like [Pholidichthys leucotaenia]
MEGQHILTTLGESDSFESVVELMAHYFRLPDNVIVWRIQFQQRRQQTGESVQWHVADLCQLAGDCQLGDLEDQMVRDQLPEHMFCSAAQSRLLTHSGELTLAMAVDIAQQYEAADKLSQDLGERTTLRPLGTSKIQPRLGGRQQQQPSPEESAPPRPVVVRCSPDSMEVVVQADLFDTGLLVDGSRLRLGSGSFEDAADASSSSKSECGATSAGEEEFILQAWLTDCGTKLSSTAEKLVYSNVLVYSPEPSADGLLRLDGVTIPVECHYENKYLVDSFSLLPMWTPSASIASVEDQLYFHLQLMTDDWQSERESYTYFLGEPIHFEVSAVMVNHAPLRVYIDRCVGTATPNAEEPLRYDFIEHGCLADAYLTNSSSHFLPRVKEHKLRFQMDAFWFFEEHNEVYITCHVKAVPTTMTVDSQNRACSLIGNRWSSIDGSDEACRSCDVSRWSEMSQPTLPNPKNTMISKSITSQAISLQNRPELKAASHVLLLPKMHQRQTAKSQQSSATSVKRVTDYRRGQSVQLGPLTVLPSRS